MTAEILRFNGVTRLPLDPEQVLTEALKFKFQSVTIVGSDESGEFYFASSLPDGPNVLWDLEIAKKKLLEIVSGE